MSHDVLGSNNFLGEVCAEADALGGREHGTGSHGAVAVDGRKRAVGQDAAHVVRQFVGGLGQVGAQRGIRGG